MSFIGNLFKPKSTPKVSEPEPAPTPDDTAITQAARRRASIARMQSGVRSAATLSTPGSRETLG